VRQVPASVPAPLTTRACADYLGFSQQWIRVSIERGVRTAGGVMARLGAESLDVGGRRRYRIHFDQFVAFLQAIGWQRLPRSADDVRPPRGARLGVESLGSVAIG
jgi:hypothetical protein